VVGADGRSAVAGPALAAPRDNQTAVALPAGRVRVIGGTADDRRILATTEVFDPATGRFSPGPR